MMDARKIIKMPKLKRNRRNFCISAPNTSPMQGREDGQNKLLFLILVQLHFDIQFIVQFDHFEI